MKKFLWHSFLFLFPFIVLLLIPLLVFWRVGELIAVDTVIRMQKEEERLVLFGQAYTNSYLNRKYKLDSALYRQPKIMILGTSRALGVRSVFFKNNSDFYNAGRGVTNMQDFNNFLDSFPNEKKPELIFLSLDQNFFYHNWQPDSKSNYLDTSLKSFIKYGWRMAYADYFKGRFTIKALLNRPSDVIAVGMNAWINSKGFRNDGSYYYGDVVNRPENKVEDIEKSKQILNAFDATTCSKDYYGEQILPQSLDKLDFLLRRSKESNIKVVGFLSPLRSGVREKMLSFNNTCARSIIELPVQVKNIFTKYSYDFFDFSDIKRYGAADEEVFDAVHASEKVMARLLIWMVKNSVYINLKDYVDVFFLEKVLKNSSNTLKIFNQ